MGISPENAQTVISLQWRRLPQIQNNFLHWYLNEQNLLGVRLVSVCLLVISVWYIEFVRPLTWLWISQISNQIMFWLHMSWFGLVIQSITVISNKDKISSKFMMRVRPSKILRWRLADINAALKHHINVSERLYQHLMRTKCLSFNSSPLSAAYMRQWIGSALVQIMACRLFGAKPLSKPMLGYFYLDP